MHSVGCDVRHRNVAVPVERVVRDSKPVRCDFVNCRVVVRVEINPAIIKEQVAVDNHVKIIVRAALVRPNIDGPVDGATLETKAFASERFRARFCRHAHALESHDSLGGGWNASGVREYAVCHVNGAGRVHVAVNHTTVNGNACRDIVRHIEGQGTVLCGRGAVVDFQCRAHVVKNHVHVGSNCARADYVLYSTKCRCKAGARTPLQV